MHKTIYIGGINRSEGSLLTRLFDGLPDVVVKKRKCLKCDKTFTSLGIFNRLCESCTRNNKNEDTAEFYAVGKN